MTVGVPIVLIALFLSGVSALETPLLDGKTWTTDPEIKAIRAMYAETEAAIKTGKLKQRKRTCTQPGEPNVRASIYENNAGTVRKYLVSGGTGDSAADASYYYDDRGRQRFTFESLRAVNGSKIETRTYFDEGGRLLYRDQKLIKGTGWAGGFADSVSDPKGSFDSLCK